MAAQSITVTKDNVDQVLASNGILTGIFFVSPPAMADWFTLVSIDDGIETVIYNIQTSSMPLPTNTYILSNASIPYGDLILRSISLGSEFNLEIDDGT